MRVLKAVVTRRAPQGARGLKLVKPHIAQQRDGSRPTRGAWIEIGDIAAQGEDGEGRAPQGARGLKYAAGILCDRDRRGRAPQGARGLKLLFRRLRRCLAGSRPTRGAWIEIPYLQKSFSVGQCRAPQGARGLKSGDYSGIEEPHQVAPHKGRVD